MDGSARVGLIGDVHGEHERLETALDYFAGRRSTHVLCTGDIPDGHGSVGRACEILREHGVLTVRGNHERWFLSGVMRDLPDATPLDDVPVSEREWLAALPVVREFTTPLGGLLLCHGLGANDMAKVGPDDEGYALVTNDDFRALVRDPRYQLVVNGHTHRPMVRHFQGLTIINAGTLRRDAPTPGFLLIDFEARVVEMLEFDETNGVVPSDSERLSLEPRALSFAPR